ncbi:hypothetical protein FA13DRAFT_14602 [Coprinellus micaceus]|uniref:Uncharacterized protein n=1 Tax=Coprinellus micaceus TaxID=71717 RepID=A0A4Y7U0Q0_COPMI|nr:hypothetical protein FA13DRAFT_14602 [Coprinellus micaceus]
MRAQLSLEDTMQHILNFEDHSLRKLHRHQIYSAASVLYSSLVQAPSKNRKPSRCKWLPPPIPSSGVPPCPCASSTIHMPLQARKGPPVIYREDGHFMLLYRRQTFKFQGVRASRSREAVTGGGAKEGSGSCAKGAWRRAMGVYHTLPFQRMGSSNLTPHFDKPQSFSPSSSRRGTPIQPLRLYTQSTGNGIASRRWRPRLPNAITGIIAVPQGQAILRGRLRPTRALLEIAEERRQIERGESCRAPGTSRMGIKSRETMDDAVKG